MFNTCKFKLMFIPHYWYWYPNLSDTSHLIILFITLKCNLGYTFMSQHRCCSKHMPPQVVDSLLHDQYISWSTAVRSTQTQSCQAMNLLWSSNKFILQHEPSYVLAIYLGSFVRWCFKMHVTYSMVKPKLTASKN